MSQYCGRKEAIKKMNKEEADRIVVRTGIVWGLLIAGLAIFYLLLVFGVI
jgi:uncharacterized integral membrane protein